MAEKGYWWCPNCHKLTGDHVSFSEDCEYCGHPVTWVEEKDPIDTLRGLAGRLSAALGDIKGQADDLHAGLTCDEAESAIHVIQDTVNEALAEARAAGLEEHDG